MRSYPKSLIIFTLILAIFGGAAYYLLVPNSFITTKLPYIFLILFASFYLSYLFLQKAEKQSFAKYLNRYMLSSMLKMALFIAVLVIYALVFRSDAKAFLIDFAVLYFFYMIFDVMMIYKQRK